MPDLRIQREHSLGLKEARRVAMNWADQCEKDFGMDCTYEEGASGDTVQFSRSGVSGTLAVSATRFDLNAKLGFLLGAFKDKIEGEITRNLDTLLASSAKRSSTAAPEAKPAAPPKKTAQPATKKVATKKKA
jgi:putative polyhydroxyalkanoate system protein